MTSSTLLRICSLALLVWGPAAAQNIPENLKVPTADVVLLKAIGKGQQIYVCSAKPGDNGQYGWLLDRPDAKLIGAHGETIGKHYKGPAWETTDGSKITGQVVERANAPQAGAVPWLLLKTKSEGGAGTLAPVTYVQRVDTVGGVAPAAGCDQSHAGAETAVDYQATYLFYGPRP